MKLQGLLILYRFHIVVSVDVSLLYCSDRGFPPIKISKGFEFLTDFYSLSLVRVDFDIFSREGPFDLYIFVCVSCAPESNCVFAQACWLLSAHIVDFPSLTVYSEISGLDCRGGMRRWMMDDG